MTAVEMLRGIHARLRNGQSFRLSICEGGFYWTFTDGVPMASGRGVAPGPATHRYLGPFRTAKAAIDSAWFTLPIHTERNEHGADR